MENHQIYPKKRTALIHLLPLVIFILSPLFFISISLPDLTLNIILSLVVLLFLLYILNKNINKILLTNTYIEFLPCYGKKSIKRIYFDKISNISILKYKNDRNKITISTTDGKFQEIHTNYYSENDKNQLFEYLKEHTACNQKEINTYSFIILMFSTIFTYQASRIIESDILITDHQTTFDLICIIFILLFFPISYICHLIIKKEKSEKLLLIISPILTASITFLLINLFYFYNESYPSSTHPMTLNLVKIDGNYQYWTLQNDAQLVLKLDSNTLNTNIKAKQLPSTINLTQGKNYQAIIKTGLLNDVFILPSTIKSIN